MKKLWSGCLLFALSVCINSNATAQSQHSCDQQAADYDGDGFGWEFDTENGRWDSCEITSESTPPPSITNRETGAPVNLIRAYWDPNADIANRDMHCENYWFNVDSGVYEERPERQFRFSSPQRSGSYNLTHLPLLSERPYINTVTGFYETDGDTSNYISLWGVENGIYHGVAPLAISPYVETVSVSGSSDNAVRIWLERDIYFLCYDGAGGSLIPTGNPTAGTTNPVATPEERVVTMPVDENAAPPPYTNLETGQQVVLTEPYWNYNADLALRRILCNTYDWDDTQARYIHEPLNDFRKLDYVFHPRVGDSVRLTSVYTDVTISIWDSVLPIDSSGNLPFSEGLGRVEIIDQAVRVWLSNTRYRQCTSTKLLGVSNQYTEIWNYPNEYQPGFFESTGYPDDDRVNFKPTGVSPIAEPPTDGICDYANAASNNGWGWNAQTRESCAPIDSTSSACDFSNAASNGGWGWNPVAGESCAPPAMQAEEQTPVSSETDACDYSDAENNGGWGWNPETRESCAPAATESTMVASETDNCDYSDAAVNGGWGWDNVAQQSCAPRN